MQMFVPIKRQLPAGPYNYQTLQDMSVDSTMFDVLTPEAPITDNFVDQDWDWDVAFRNYIEQLRIQRWLEAQAKILDAVMRMMGWGRHRRSRKNNNTPSTPGFVINPVPVIPYPIVPVNPPNPDNPNNPDLFPYPYHPPGLRVPWWYHKKGKPIPPVDSHLKEEIQELLKKGLPKNGVITLPLWSNEEPPTTIKFRNVHKGNLNEIVKRQGLSKWFDIHGDTSVHILGGRGGYADDMLFGHLYKPGIPENVVSEMAKRRNGGHGVIYYKFSAAQHPLLSDRLSENDEEDRRSIIQDRISGTTLEKASLLRYMAPTTTSTPTTTSSTIETANTTTTPVLTKSVTSSTLTKTLSTTTTEPSTTSIVSKETAPTLISTNPTNTTTTTISTSTGTTTNPTTVNTTTNTGANTSGLVNETLKNDTTVSALGSSSVGSTTVSEPTTTTTNTATSEPTSSSSSTSSTSSTSSSTTTKTTTTPTTTTPTTTTPTTTTTTTKTTTTTTPTTTTPTTTTPTISTGTLGSRTLGGTLA